MCVLLYRPVNRLYNVNCSRRKVNTVSRLPPVSVWLIVSREIILLPAELIPLPEEANRSRHKCMEKGDRNEKRFDRDHERVATPVRRADCPVASSLT